MDVSIAVSLIRGQMGAVVERAVNGAVETVLAEILEVVGVKFEELKSQVALMKRDVTTLQREKAQKEKENDNIRAKLRYTELKLKYYRQGVEEELQQRASASTLVRIHPSTFLQTQRGGAGVSSSETSPSCSSQSRSSDRPLSRNNQGNDHRNDRLLLGRPLHSESNFCLCLSSQNAPLHTAPAGVRSECAVLQTWEPTAPTRLTCCCLSRSLWTRRQTLWTAAQVTTGSSKL